PGLLASGGGSSDNTVRFWDTRQSSTSSIQRVDSKSQVCNLAWSKNSNEFVTTHGYSKNWVFTKNYFKPIAKNILKK
ncbi:substrate-specific activator of APC-dependent proteolysis, partial [Bonamia ostreae]